MSAINEQQENNWWAEGDTPVQAHSHVSYRVDARSALLTVCRHFLMAQKYIYVAGWGMTPTMKLVRGKDHRTGPDGSPEQEALLAELLAQVSVTCMLDDSSHGLLHHPVASLHQKIAVVDGTHAFVGGIDVLIEL